IVAQFSGRERCSLKRMCLFQMTVWWRALILLSFILNCVDSHALSPVVQRNKYYNSFRLTRSTRIRVQQLLKKYKEQHLGNKHFEDRSRQLKDLPLLSTDFYSWLQLPDWDRLHTAFLNMQIYWNMLERKRKQLEKEKTEQVMARVVRSTLPQSIKHIQLDLRDLMSQVSSQVSTSSWIKPTSPTSMNPESSKTVWDSRVEGYIILRDLDFYLTKLARDFLLLASKTHL
uniref:Ciliary neurotrophic factor n=1 Tax=Monopterus albus TaxID=43700 RepID=A0A3Q3K7J9_MONAL